MFVNIKLLFDYVVFFIAQQLIFSLKSLGSVIDL
jgi:hypothetical protein